MLTDPELIRDYIIKPSREILNEFWTDKHPSEADVELLAIAQQESGCCNRFQRLASGYPGTARSLWQIETNTCSAVLVRWPALRQCLSRIWIKEGDHVFAALLSDPLHPWLAWSDMAAFWTARGILALDPAPLPAIGDIQGAWDCYIKNWRPGKPRLNDWRASYEIALDAIGYGHYFIVANPPGSLA